LVETKGRSLEEIERSLNPKAWTMMNFTIFQFMYCI
jgi:hypothetical protein